MSSQAVNKQRDVQREVAAADSKGEQKPERAMQAGARLYPEPFPSNTSPSPGRNIGSIRRRSTMRRSISAPRSWTARWR